MTTRVLITTIGTVFALATSVGANAEPGELSPAQIAREILSLHNSARIDGRACLKATTRLSWNTKLAAAARKHSTDMHNNGFLAHSGSDGSDAKARLKNVNYDWIAYGENISHGQDTPAEAVQGWLTSLAHCKNVMNPDFKEMGAAKVGDFWTVIFGSRP